MTNTLEDEGTAQKAFKAARRVQQAVADLHVLADDLERTQEAAKTRS
ncbi:MAG: hypothetical protein AAGA48_28695 [Myxococcota bacterium]